MIFTNKLLKRYKNFIIFIIILIIIVLPKIIFSAPIIFQQQIDIPDFQGGEVGSGTIAKYLSAFYQWAVVAIAVLAVIMIMVSGLRWIFAAGNPPAVKQAQDQLFAALIGLVLSLIAVPMLSMINPALVRLSSFEIPYIKEKEIKEKCTDPESKTACDLRGECPEGQVCTGKVVIVMGKDKYECSCSVPVAGPPGPTCSGEASFQEVCSAQKIEAVYKRVYKGDESKDVISAYKPCVLKDGTCQNLYVTCKEDISPTFVPCQWRLPERLGDSTYSCVDANTQPPSCRTTDPHVIECTETGIPNIPCCYRYVDFSGGRLPACIPASGDKCEKW